MNKQHIPTSLGKASDTTTYERDVAALEHFPCQQCGADLSYTPGSNALSCDYCGFENPIPEKKTTIQEYDFSASLTALREKQRQQDKSHHHSTINIIHCKTCGASFELHTNEHSGRCPFCDSTVVTDTQEARHIQPESLLPFAITDKQAQEAYKTWLSSRWFAPSALKQKAKNDEELSGIYLPYWTYDSHTQTWYQGQRGKVYYERQYYTAVVDGRTVRQVRNVPRIRWTPVSGRVARFFDDVLIGASRTLPRKILDPLQPWDLHNLKPYSHQYLSGFRSEIYQVELDEGFQQAEGIMKRTIEHDIRRDIGGDQQRITHTQVKHQNTRFKHLLLPIWSSAFKYQGKTYRFVVNGRTGKVAGERPYSKIKIALAVLAGLILAGFMLYYAEEAGIFEQMMQQPMSPNSPMYYDPYNQSPYRSPYRSY
jgi:DNA-directed RNA polymerase subunit RPC12/RpoP